MSPLQPLVISWLAGAALLMFDGRRRVVVVAAAGVAAAVFALDLLALRQLAGGAAPFEVVSGGWPTEVGIRLRIDGLSAFFATICSGVLVVVLVHEALAGVRFRLFPALILLMGAGLHGAFATGDLFNFYVFFELAVVSSFALAAYGYGRAEIRGAFVYVVVNLFGSVLFLIGVAGIYGATGTLDFRALTPAADAEGPSLLLPSTLIFVALSLKLGLFPLHGWVPVLYRQARPPVVAAMTGALVNLGAYGLIRMSYTAFDGARDQAAGVLLALGALALLYGTVLAVFRKDAAELGGYVSVGHAGYVVLALGIGGSAGVLAILLVVLAGSLDKATAFLALDAAGSTRRLAALVAAASMAGLPLTAGFAAKAQLLRAAADAVAGPLVLAAVVAGGVLLLAAAFRFYRLVRDSSPRDRARGLATGVLAAAVVALGLAAEPVVRAAIVIGDQVVRGDAP